MRLKILDVPVRQNIELFLEILRRSKRRELAKNIPLEKIFNAWLHRETGQLMFAEASPEALFLGKTDWKPIKISYHYDPRDGEIAFLMEEREINLKGFRCDDMTPASLKTMRETMITLNRISHQLKGPSDLATKITVLTKLTIDGSLSHGDRNIIIDTWHFLDRLAAESVLGDKPIGTYLFRKDHFTKILEQQLIEQHKKPIKCFTLTYSKSNKKFCDLTLVHFKGAWQFYDDDPSLNKQVFTELSELLAQCRGVLKYPLYQ